MSKTKIYMKPGMEWLLAPVVKSLREKDLQDDTLLADESVEVISAKDAQALLDKHLDPDDDLPF